MKLLFIYINPTGRNAIPPNVSMLLGYLRSNSNHTIELFDTTSCIFNIGIPAIESSWTPGYFLPTNEQYRIPGTAGARAELLDIIKKNPPDLVALSCYSNQFAIATELCACVKSAYPEIKTVVGGVHPSLMPENVISNEHIDIICVGEGEEALLELCDRIEKKQDITQICNLWVKENGRVYKNRLRKPIDLDFIGEPAWDLFDPRHIYQPFHGGYFRTGMIEFGRGCPFRCTYCANAGFIDLYNEAGRSYFRHRNPERFIQMLKSLKKKYNLELIYFQDGTFLTMPDEVLEELARLYNKEINLPCIILTTATSINEKRVSLLKKMSCIYINIGIESGSREFRTKYLNRNMSNETIINAFNLIRNSRIYSAAYNVIGFPHETREDVFATIELNRLCRPDSVYTQIFYPIDGCKLKTACIEEGFYNSCNESLHSQIYGVGNVSILENMTMSREQIHGLLRTFYLYVRMPEELHPMLEGLEEDTPVARKVIRGLTEYYWKQEPFFGDENALSYKKLRKKCGVSLV